MSSINCITRKVFFIAVSLVCIYPNAAAQNAFHVATGRSFISDKLEQGRPYDVWLIKVGYLHPFSSPESRLRINGSLNVEYGIISTRSAGHRDFDLAFTGSFECVWSFSKPVALAFNIGTGPAYQSSISPLQAHGFVFSNHFAIGLQFSLLDNTVIVFPQVMFRHLSNAKLASPNTGIDTFLAAISIGVPVNIFRELDRK